MCQIIVSPTVQFQTVLNISTQLPTHFYDYWNIENSWNNIKITFNLLNTVERGRALGDHQKMFAMTVKFNVVE